jgi:general secretion pathway protein F
MAAFNYLALDNTGKRQKGVMEADTPRQVRQKLRDLELTPLDVNEVMQGKSSKNTSTSFSKLRTLFVKRMSARDLSLVTRQLATLLGAGIPVDDALTAVANQSEKPHIKSVILGVRSKVMEGHTLAAALDNFPNCFPQIYRTTIACGEKSGKLDHILLKLAEFTENQHAIHRKINQALIYPAMMTLVSIGVVTFLLIYVVPKIIDVFSQTQQTLPMATLILITLSHGIKNYGLYILLTLVILGILGKRLLKKPHFKKIFDHWLLKIPVLGKNIRTINSARFARTFGILSSASVPVLDAMHGAAQLIYSLPMREAVIAAIDQVREGTSIHRALQQTTYFSPMFVHLIASGESSGQLESMLQKAAAQQESDVEALIQGTLTLFEPLMILVMGSVVLFIVLAVMLPIFALDQING